MSRPAKRGPVARDSDEEDSIGILGKGQKKMKEFSIEAFEQQLSRRIAFEPAIIDDSEWDDINGFRLKGTKRILQEGLTEPPATCRKGIYGMLLTARFPKDGGFPYDIQHQMGVPIAHSLFLEPTGGISFTANGELDDEDFYPTRLSWGKLHAYRAADPLGTSDIFKLLLIVESIPCGLGCVNPFLDVAPYGEKGLLHLSEAANAFGDESSEEELYPYDSYDPIGA